VSRSQADQVPADWVRRQTVKNAERYITAELKSFEDKVLGARDRALARERELYEGLLDRLTGWLPRLQATAAAVAALDVLANLAERALALRLVRRGWWWSRASRSAPVATRWWNAISTARSSRTTCRCTTRGAC